MVAWILKLAPREAAQHLNELSVSEVAKLQAIGLVAIAIAEAVLPKGANSKLTADELGEVAKLLSYRSMPPDRILECQEVICKRFSTGKCK